MFIEPVVEYWAEKWHIKKTLWMRIKCFFGIHIWVWYRVDGLDTFRPGEIFPVLFKCEICNREGRFMPKPFSKKQILKQEKKDWGKLATQKKIPKDLQQRVKAKMDEQIKREK